MNVPKNKKPPAKVYVDKIALLHEELEGVIRKLSVVHEDIAIHSDNLSEVRDSILEGKHSIKGTKDVLESLGVLISKAKGEYSSLVSEHGAELERHRQRKEELNSTIKSLEKDVKNLESEKESHGNVVLKINQVRDELKGVEAQVEQAKSLLNNTIDSTRQIEQDLSTKKQEVEDLITKHGKILTDTIKNLDVIRIYVRRLQRFYDKAGIKIDVIKQFNAEDNEQIT